jgi:hypothetical protein
VGVPAKCQNGLRNYSKRPQSRNNEICCQLHRKGSPSSCRFEAPEGSTTLNQLNPVRTFAEQNTINSSLSLSLSPHTRKRFDQEARYHTGTFRSQEHVQTRPVTFASVEQGPATRSMRDLACCSEPHINLFPRSKTKTR